MSRREQPAYETRKETFPSRFRTLAEEKDLTQAQLADMIGVRRQTVSLYFNGQSIPDSDVLKRIAVSLDVSADWLLGLSNIRNPEILLDRNATEQEKTSVIVDVSLEYMKKFDLAQLSTIRDMGTDACVYYIQFLDHDRARLLNNIISFSSSLDENKLKALWELVRVLHPSYPDLYSLSDSQTEPDSCETNALAEDCTASE